MPLASELRRLFEHPEPERRFGPFLLIHQLGRGAFAPVWLAREVYGDVEVRRVAIKLFALDAPVRKRSRSTFSRERVLDEARLLDRLEHPNIVRFYSTLTDDESGIMGLVMEYVEGPSLEQRLAARGPLPLDQAVDIGAKIASALSAVHRAGLIHRDVKPANIIAGPTFTKLIDFGIATARPAEAGRAERSGGKRISLNDLPREVLGTNLSLLGSTVTISTTTSSDEPQLPSGTVGYIDPLCISAGLSATPQSDIYALGATLFEAITGKLPSVAAAMPNGGMRGDVLDGRARAPELASLVPDVPKPVATLVDAMLAPERDARPASAEAIAVELERIRSLRTGRARSLPSEETGPFRVGRYALGDRDLYFGRSREQASALEMLRSQGLVALVGAKGSGKSSLLHAGIASTIAERGLDDLIESWDPVLVELGPSPRAAFREAVAPFVPRAELLEPEAIVLALSARAASSRRGALIVFDDFERILEALPDEAAFVAELVASVAEPPRPGLRAVVAIQRERLDPLLSIGALGRVLPRSMLLVAEMSASAWVDALRESAAAYGYSFENDALVAEIAEALVDKSRRESAQRALITLWKKRDRSDKLLRRKDLAPIARPEVLLPAFGAPQAPPPGFGPPPASPQPAQPSPVIERSSVPAAMAGAPTPAAPQAAPHSGRKGAAKHVLAAFAVLAALALVIFSTSLRRPSPEEADLPAKLPTNPSVPTAVATAAPTAMSSGSEGDAGEFAKLPGKTRGTPEGGTSFVVVDMSRMKLDELKSLGKLCAKAGDKRCASQVADEMQRRDAKSRIATPPPQPASVPNARQGPPISDVIK